MSRAALLSIAFVAALLLAPGRARADESDTDDPEARGSIYRINLAVDIPIVAMGAVGTAVPYLASSAFVHPRCPCDREEVNILDRHAIGNDSKTAATIGNVGVALVVTAPVAMELLAMRPARTLYEDLAVYAEVMAVNGGLLALSKFVVQRPTPLAYAGDPDAVENPGGYLSFYSGHTSFAFASLSFAAFTLSIRDGQRVWPWIVTGLLGGGVATVMVLSGAHFPTDVAMGAVAGTAVGVGVPLLHLRPSRRVRVSIVPGPGAGGLALLGRF